MQTFIGTPTTVVTIEYHAPGFNHERVDIIGIRSEFLFLKNVRTRTINIPAAGSDTLRLIIEFIGINAAAGIIGYFEGKIFDKIIKAIHKTRKHSEKTYSMKFTGVKFIYEDTEIIIENLESLNGEDIKKILKQIPDILSNEDNLPINKIELPIIYIKPFFQLWNVNQAENTPEHFRYWLLNAWGNSGIPMIYDSQTKRTLTYDDLGHYYDLETDEVYNLLERLITDQTNYDK